MNSEDPYGAYSLHMSSIVRSEAPVAVSVFEAFPWILGSQVPGGTLTHSVVLGGTDFDEVGSLMNKDSCLNVGGEAPEVTAEVNPSGPFNI